VAWNPLFGRFFTSNYIWFCKEGTIFILNHRIAVTIGLLSLVCLPNVYAGSTISNEVIARKLIVDGALEQVHLQASEVGAVVCIIVQDGHGNSEISSWMKRCLIDSAVKAGYAVYTQLEEAPDSAAIVEIADANIKFEYESIGNKWLFFNRGYNRSAEGDFHISIRKKNGKVLFSQQVHKDFADTLSSTDMVENGELVFTKGKKTDPSLGKRLIEPVLITASTITMVYLFYSLRSGK
jgi:hypothetical protein